MWLDVMAGRNFSSTPAQSLERWWQAKRHPTKNEHSTNTQNSKHIYSDSLASKRTV